MTLAMIIHSFALLILYESDWIDDFTVIDMTGNYVHNLNA